MKPKEISAVFRADATKSGGVGHVMRCLALAEAWTARGGKASLMARTKGTLAEAAVAAAGLDCLEASQANLDEDARRVAHHALDRQADWVILDGYGFDENYEEMLKSEYPTGRVAVVNDFLRPSRADIFVVPSSPLPRGSRISPGPTVLVGGFDFAVLRKEYSAAPREPRTLPASAPRILVVLGGTDAVGMVGSVVDSLLPAARAQGWILRVIAPERAMQADEPCLERINPSPSIAKVMKDSDLVVCTASTVALEACASGLPQVLLVVAENQKAVAESLTARGSALLAADPADVVTKITAALRAENYSQMSACAASIIDGRGAQRVVAAMTSMDFTLRTPTSDDLAFTFELSNDPEIRKASFNSQPIAWEEHAAWFHARLADAKTWMRIAEDSCGEPFGVFRLQEDASEEYVLSVALAATHRGLKIAAPLVKTACAEFSREQAGKPIRAEVKPGNIPSERTFHDAGFSLSNESSERLIFHLRP